MPSIDSLGERLRGVPAPFLLESDLAVSCLNLCFHCFINKLFNFFFLIFKLFLIFFDIFIYQFR